MRDIAAWAMCSVLVLTACAEFAGSPLAGPEGDRDGRTMMARPGLARLYLCQGISRLNSAQPIPYGAITIHTAPDPRPGMTATIIGGALQGIAAGLDAVRERPAEPPLGFTAQYYVAGRLVGTMREGQYLALDLPPGEHPISWGAVGKGARTAAPITARLVEGQVAYLRSVLDAKGEFVLEDCPDACPSVILAGGRVVTNALQ